MTLATLLAAALLVAPQQPVSGHVRLSSGKPASNAVLILEGAPKSQPLKKAVVDQRGRKFIPRVTVVTVGTEVEFPNNDTIFHNVFAEFEAKRFDLGLYPRGHKRTQRFDKPGVVALFCSIHPEMSAFIMVVDTPYYAVADAQGRFQLDKAPPGKYALKIWHESGERLVQEVSWPPTGIPVYSTGRR